MNDIEAYAVNLVGEGAASLATDDLDEEGQFDNEDDWREARALGVKMGRAIKDNPEAFANWYRLVAPKEAIA